MSSSIPIISRQGNNDIIIVVKFQTIFLVFAFYKTLINLSKLARAETFVLDKTSSLKHTGMCYSNAALLNVIK